MYNCKNLLNDSIESYYWIGFIVADGCISKFLNKSKNEVIRLTINLHKKDRCILENLVKFLKNGHIIDYGDYTKVAYVTGASEVKNKFKFNYQKTYNPTDFSVFENCTNDQLLALLCGIIDGDGSITYKHDNTTVFIRIAAYYKWQNFYEKLLNRLNIHFTIIQDKETAISICIQDKYGIFDLYDKVLKLNLPLLKRKWDKIKTIPKDKNNWIPIEQYDLNGNKINEFKSLEEAEQKTGIKAYGICKCCKGKIKKSGGYIWKYK